MQICPPKLVVFHGWCEPNFNLSFFFTIIDKASLCNMNMLQHSWHVLVSLGAYGLYAFLGDISVWKQSLPQ